MKNSWVLTLIQVGKVVFPTSPIGNDGIRRCNISSENRFVLAQNREKLTNMT